MARAGQTPVRTLQLQISLNEAFPLVPAALQAKMSAVKRGLEAALAAGLERAGISGSPATKLQRNLLDELSSEDTGTGSAHKTATPTTPRTGSSRSTSSSSAHQDKSEGKKAGKGGGKGRGKGRRGNQGPQHKIGEGSTETRVSTAESLLLMCMRLLCLHENEFRRQNRKTQQVYKLGKNSQAKAELKEEDKDWKAAIPEKTEEDPFPQHGEGPLRFFSFRRLFEAVGKRCGNVVSAMAADEQAQVKKALETLANMQLIRSGVLRFYLMRKGDENEEGDKAKEMWVIRLAPNSARTKIDSAVTMLDSLDVLHCISMEVQQDRAPKGGIQRGLESALKKVLGGNRSKKASSSE